MDGRFSVLEWILYEIIWNKHWQFSHLIGEKSKNIKTKSTIITDGTLFLNSGTLQAQGLESKNINAQISNQNNIDDLQETLACLSTGFTYGRNRGDHTQHFKTVESYPQ